MELVCRNSVDASGHSVVRAQVGQSRVNHFVAGDRLAKILAQSREDLNLVFGFGKDAVPGRVFRAGWEVWRVC